jgi:hypothetical protein
MKIHQIFESDLKMAPPPKVKKLQYLTPELLAKHHALIIDALAAYVPANDLDILQGKIEGEPDDVDFNLSLLVKALPKETKPSIREKDGKYIGGALNADLADFHYPDIWTNNLGREEEYTATYYMPKAYYFVRFAKNRWQVQVNTHSSDSKKRFERPEEVIDFVKKLAVKMKKERDYALEWVENKKKELKEKEAK